MNPSWIIYHPKRHVTNFDDFRVYHDSFSRNQDPYLWSHRFLHTYCHITEMTNVQGQINFWVSGDAFPNFKQLLCDCVFVVDEKIFWNERNRIDRDNPIVENDQVFLHHYQWPERGEHIFKKRRRYTLKANSKSSFQPQSISHELIDIVPFLNQKGIDTLFLNQKMTKGRASKPMQLDSKIGKELFDQLNKQAEIKIYGSDLAYKHPRATKYW